MSDQNNSNAGTPNRATSNTPSNPTAPRLTQQQLVELTNKFKEAVTEAKRVGETTPRGKELLIQASKIKAIYDKFSRARQIQEAAAAAAVGGSSTGNSTTNVTTQQTSNSNSSSATSMSNIPTPNNGNNTANNTANNNNQFATLMKDALTPEQKQQYEKLTVDFQTRAKNIRDKHSFIKQNVDTLTQEITKQTDLATKNQLTERRTELLNNLKLLGAEHNSLRAQFQNGRKNFFIESAKKNPKLQSILQGSTQQASTTPAAQTQQQPQNVQKQVPQQAISQQEIQARKKALEVAKKQQQQSQTNVKSEASTKGVPAESLSSTAGNNISAQVTNVNAAAASNVSNASSKQNMFKTSEPNIPITENLTAKSPTAVSYRVNRPTMSGGSAMTATALNTPVLTKIPPYEIDTERVMSKRKLRELVKTVGIDEGDGETVIDGDVEELLLDLADDFVTNVTSFACRLAKHRRSDNLNVKDIQLHLERNWNIRIPGYSADEIRSTRKWNPSTIYNQKLQAVNGEKNHKGQSTTGKIMKK
ncbi:transcription initiation factor TFIID subunit 12 [Monosporozyma unispora]|nr:Transcription initiation factor TFIID subunit 12 [Kazachstania unispora]